MAGPTAYSRKAVRAKTPFRAAGQITKAATDATRRRRVAEIWQLHGRRGVFSEHERTHSTHQLIADIIFCISRKKNQSNVSSIVSVVCLIRSSALLDKFFQRDFFKGIMERPRIRNGAQNIAQSSVI
jgi:hypothetical protein